MHYQQFVPLVRKNQTQDIYKNLISLLNYAFKNIPRNKNKRMEEKEAIKLSAKVNQLRDSLTKSGHHNEVRLIFAWMEARINHTSIREELEK
jgi:hypothetical protein